MVTSVETAATPSRRRRVLLAVLPVLVLAGVLEVGSRIGLYMRRGSEPFRQLARYEEIPLSQIRYERHHYLNYALRPGYADGERSHNSLGFRGEEFTREKPAGIYRIVVLGGSTVYTEHVGKDKDAFPARLQAILRERYGHDHVQVINAGVPGYDSWGSLINLVFRVLDLAPDLVIIYHGTNDVHSRLVLPAAYRADNSGRCRPYDIPALPWYERSCFVRVVRRCLGRSRQFVLQDFVVAHTASPDTVEPAKLLDANKPDYFRRNLESMIAVARSRGIEIVLSTWAHSSLMHDYAATQHYQRGFRENNAVVEDVAKDQGVHLFDFAAKMPDSAAYWADGRHVNEKGANLKAELFAEYLDASGLTRRVVPGQ